MIELYKSYLELSLAIGLTILFLYLHILFSESLYDMTVFVDLSLAPWLIWLTKKIVDTFKSYGRRIRESKVKYASMLRELELKGNSIMASGPGSIDAQQVVLPMIDNSLE